MALHLKASIRGDTFGDLEIALEELKQRVENQFTSGFDRNETGSYQFDITGEEEEEEEED